MLAQPRQPRWCPGAAYQGDTGLRHDEDSLPILSGQEGDIGQALARCTWGQEKRTGASLAGSPGHPHTGLTGQVSPLEDDSTGNVQGARPSSVGTSKQEGQPCLWPTQSSGDTTGLSGPGPRPANLGGVPACFPEARGRGPGPLTQQLVLPRKAACPRQPSQHFHARGGGNRAGPKGAPPQTRGPHHKPGGVTANQAETRRAPVAPPAPLPADSIPKA